MNLNPVYADTTHAIFGDVQYLSKLSEAIGDAVYDSAEAFIKAKNLNSDKLRNIVTEALEDITLPSGNKYSLSEKSYKLMREQVKSYIENGPTRAMLSNYNPNTTSVGNLTASIFPTLFMDVGSDTNKDFTLSAWFPDVTVPEYDVQIDYITAIAGLLAPHTPGEQVQTIKNQETYSRQYQSIGWAGIGKITALDMLQLRKKGGDIGERGIQQKISYIGMTNIIKAYTTKNWYMSLAVMNGGFEYRQKSYSMGISSDTTLAFSVPLQINDAPNDACNPIQQLGALLNQNTAFRPYRSYLRQIIMNRTDWTYLTENANVQAFLGNRYLSSEKKDWFGATKEVLRFNLGGLGDVEFVIEDSQWVDIDPNTGMPDMTTSKFYIPNGKAFVGLDLSGYGGSLGAFHLTPSVISGDYANPSAGLGSMLFNLSQYNPGQPEIDILTYLYGGPAIYRPQNIWTIQLYPTS